MRILIVGMGSMGKRRARLSNSLNAGHVVFGVDANKERRIEAQALGVRCFESISSAVLTHNFNAAFVCTAPLSHAQIINELLDNNLPVFSEINLVSDGYAGLIDKAKQKNLPLFLSSTMLYRAEIEYISKTVHEFNADVNYIYHIGQYLPDWHPWENFKDFFVGNPRTGGVREIFGIEMPWLVSTFGKVRDFTTSQNSISKLNLPYCDSVFVTLQHENGVKGFLAADVVSPKAVRNLEIFGDGLHLFWEGNPKSLFLYDKQLGEKVPVNVYENVEHTEGYSDNIVENAYLDEIIDFFDVLEGKSVGKWSFEKDAEVVALMNEILQEGN